MIGRACPGEGRGRGKDADTHNGPQCITYLTTPAAACFPTAPSAITRAHVFTACRTLVGWNTRPRRCDDHVRSIIKDLSGMLVKVGASCELRTIKGCEGCWWAMTTAQEVGDYEGGQVVLGA